MNGCCFWTFNFAAKSGEYEELMRLYNNVHEGTIQKQSACYIIIINYVAMLLCPRVDNKPLAPGLQSSDLRLIAAVLANLFPIDSTAYWVWVVL